MSADTLASRTIGVLPIRSIIESKIIGAHGLFQYIGISCSMSFAQRLIPRRAPEPLRSPMPALRTPRVLRAYPRSTPRRIDPSAAIPQGVRPTQPTGYATSPADDTPPTRWRRAHRSAVRLRLPPASVHQARRARCSNAAPSAWQPLRWFGTLRHPHQYRLLPHRNM